MQNRDWKEDTIVYGVIPDLFGENGLRSVTERLPYLQELGVNAIWLSPINAGPEGDFGYAVTDYFSLKPKVGTKKDFSELVTIAHTLGIRVLMDIVPNHTSVEHPWFRDAESGGLSSPYYAFYDRDEAGDPTHYFDWVKLPNLNFDHADVWHTMLEAFAYWVRESDVDGYRVDIAWGIKKRAPDFWPACRRELDQIKPGVLLLAEASARDPYYAHNGFDAAYDWTDELGHWAWEDVLKRRDGIAGRLRSALTADDRGYDPATLIFRFLNNNDTGPRFIEVHGPELTRTAAALLLTLPGIPCIYTGDEIGASYLPYGDPPPVDWDADPFALGAWYRQLIGLRHQLPSLRSREWELVNAVPQEHVLAYVRYGGAAEAPSLVMLNFSDDAVEASVSLPGEFRSCISERTLFDALDERRSARLDGDSVLVRLPAWGVSVLHFA